MPRTVSLASQQDDDALHWQFVATADQNIVALDAQLQCSVAAGYQFDMNDPGLVTADSKYLVRLRCDRREIRIDDADITELAAEQELKPRARMSLQ